MADKYTLVLKGEPKVQKFTDAREAAVAFYNAQASKEPNVIRQGEDGGARFLASTREHREPSGEQTFSKIPPPVEVDKAFREAYDKETRERGDRSREQIHGPAIGRSVEKASGTDLGERIEIRDTKAGSKIEAIKAREGESYQGRVVAITEKHVVQHAVDKEGRDLGHVAHERKAVSGLKEESAVDQLHRISYPHGSAGLARQIDQLETKHSHGDRAKANAGKERSS